MKNLLMIMLGIFLSGCARLPLDSRRWVPIKHVSDIKWGGRSAATEGKLRMDGFYMSTGSSMGFVFYDDGTCVDFGMEKISVDSLASNMQAELRRKGIRRKIWRYDESGIYTMANDTIKVNSYWSDFFLFQNLWRMMTKRVFVVKSDSEIVEIKRKVIWVDIPCV